jgi:hypothetical protein
VLKICLKNGYTCDNDGKDGDQKSNSPCDQLDYNVFTYHSDVEFEQVKLKLLEGIQHFDIGLVWNNQEYER